MGLEPEQLRLLNDDRVGRALDRLFDTDRQALLTDLVVRMVREFKVALEGRVATRPSPTKGDRGARG
jgi:hypothetical protein